MRKLIIATVFFALLTASAWLYAFRGEIRDAYRRWQRGPIPPAISRMEVLRSRGVVIAAVSSPPPSPGVPTKTAPLPSARPAPTEPDGSIPRSLNLRVLFVPQAPFKEWDEVHEDTCEEAAMLMLKAYHDDELEMTLDEMERRLLAAVAYQTETFGDFKSTDAARTAEIMRGHLGMSDVRVVPIDSITDVRREIAAGRPVILPAAGKLLMNPNFKNGGPLYHMLVAKGYTAGSIVTNDPGTRVGEDYVYADDVLWNAIHDWNGGDVENGAKVMIVVGE